MHEAMSRMGFGGAERSSIETGFSDCLDEAAIDPLRS